uniref:AAA+ ATPase domain-containing protein n=1 Tax=Dendroctonus ponderosae TaxID=77166 RepID=A0AAR5Q6H2_DENPD
MTSKNNQRLSIPNHLEKIKVKTRERRRNLLYLVLAFLREQMLDQTADALLKEARLDDGYQVCENVELDIILQEYQSYYYTKFQKYPKIIRKLEDSEPKPPRKSNPKRGRSAKRTIGQEKADSPSDSEDFQFEIIPLNASNSPSGDLPDERDNKDLPELVSNQLVIEDTGVRWSDCLGLNVPIEILKESTLYPLYYPEVFKDLTPWKGVLLHGPPGTGKTLLAKALAYEGRTTLFNVTNSQFISKWRGESEKLIKNLFDTAKNHAPSTIFLDEIDALVSGVQDTQHEASKRFRSELLTQLDGILPNHHRIFVLAATNSPWDLDNALLRRFDKRILVDMPDKAARPLILKHHMKSTVSKLSSADWEVAGKWTENYSGSDLRNLAKEVSMGIARERIKTLQTGAKSGPTRAVCLEDIKKAVDRIRPSSSSVLTKKYYQWQNEHGAL